MTWASDRPSTTARGYGNQHQQERKRWASLIKASGGVPCSRACGHVITDGERWHLDHSDDRTAYLGPSCERCNLSAAGRKGKAARPKLRRSPGGKVGRTE